MAQVTQVSVHVPEPPEQAGQVGTLAPEVPVPNGPIERFMAALIRKLSWSKLADPKVAMAISGVGLLLGMLVGATAPNVQTLPFVRLPLSHLLTPLGDHGLISDAVATTLLYTGDVLACLGLAGMLWAHSQGWRPDPRRLLLASAAVVAVMVNLTPVGSSDTASFAAYGLIAAHGGNPYILTPHLWGDHTYTRVVGGPWRNVPSVYGPIATLIQAFAAWIGGPQHVAITIWVLMILTGAVFVGVGYLLLKTSDDPVRATLFWVANPVLIQQLVGGGQIDTFLAAAAICAIQAARRLTGKWGDVLTGVLIGLTCGIKINGLLIAAGLALPLLMRREWMRTARIAAVSLATIALEYGYYGLSALKPLRTASGYVGLPSPWRVFQAVADVLGVPSSTTTTLISVLWLIALLVIAWLIYQRISSDQPREVVAPFALAFAWILVAPWVFAWYTALAWVTLTQVPRNRMTRWLAIVTVLLALWRSGGGHGGPQL